MDFRRVVIITGQRAAGWSRAMAIDVARSLDALDIETQLIEIERLGDYVTSAEARDPRTLFLDFNHRIVFPEDRPTVSIMLDHPCSLMKELAAKHSENAVTAWVDATHGPAVQALGFRHRAMFLPHAGPTPSASCRAFDERDIDVFFAGTLGEPIDRASWAAANPDAAPIVADLLFDTIERIEATGGAVLPVLLAVMQQHGLSPAALTRDNFAELMDLALRIGEINRRVNILETLPRDLTLVIASDHLPACLKDRGNIRYAGYIEDFDEICGLMRRARVVLNATSKFPAGSHERIWYGIAAGAAVLTDLSVFMKQDFVDRENIFYLPQRRLAAGDISAVIKDNARLDAIADRARTVYAARHSWMKRAPLLAEALHVA